MYVRRAGFPIKTSKLMIVSYEQYWINVCASSLRRPIPRSLEIVGNDRIKGEIAAVA